MTTSDIVLCTINAKYIHASVGLRYLKANLGPWEAQTEILEATHRESPAEIAEKILARQPRLVGLGVYIWNAEESAELASILKRLRPEVVVVVGGPEVSHEVEAQAITQRADYVVTGEGEAAFRALVDRVLKGGRPLIKVHPGGEPPLHELELPYRLYTDDDLRHRVVYVEASRGCPYRCEFCLSSLDRQVRMFDPPRLFAALENLLQRGVTQFKFVDRTFNLRVDVSRAILDFFWERHRPGLFLHFEMVPDRLPAELRESIARFPAGALQFEVGIQTFDPEVGKRISRRQNIAKLEENLRWLRQCTGVHVHTDLIAGLPGEDVHTFAQGFDRLVALGPQEIQVGILKRLRGAPINRHTEAWRMVYRERPPYDVLQTSAIDFATMQRIKRFAKVWDTLCNSGNFTGSAPLIWGEGSPFWEFMAFTDWLHSQEGRVHSIALERIGAYLRRYLCEQRGLSEEAATAAVVADYTRTGRTKIARLLQDSRVSGDGTVAALAPPAQAAPPARQRRHLAGA